MVLQRYRVQCSSRFYLSFLNSAFKYWLESGIKKHLKRKGGGLSACMAPGRYEEPVWKWCILSPSAVVLFMDNIESLGQWAAGWVFFITTWQMFPPKLHFQRSLTPHTIHSWICNFIIVAFYKDDFKPNHHSDNMHFQLVYPELSSVSHTELDAPIYTTSNEPSPFMNTSNVWGV